MQSFQANKSILTGFTILEEVLVSGEPIGSREISRRLSIEHSKVNRILSTLVVSGMLQKTEDRKYFSGPALHIFTALSLHHSKIITHSLPVLKEFQKEGATVALGTLWRDVVVYLLHANPQKDLALTTADHENHPKDKSIIGLLLQEEDKQSICMEREDSKEVACAARLGSLSSVGIAVVYPSEHPCAKDLVQLEQRVLLAGEAIARKMNLMR